MDFAFQMRASRAPPWKLSLILVAGVLLLLPAAQGVAPVSGTEGHAAVPGGVDLGDGLFTLTPVQQVSATPYWYNFNCASQARFAWCVDPVGVTYIGPAGRLIVSEQQCTVYCNGTHNELVEFNLANSSYGTPLLVNCYPYTPYFPGYGNEYFVPCWNEGQNWSSLLGIDYQTNTIVANITSAGGMYSMAFDSSNGMLIGGSGSSLEVIDPATGLVNTSIRVPTATFEPTDSIGIGFYGLVYDPATNTMIVPSTEDKLLSVDLSNGVVETSIPLPAGFESLAIDPETEQLFASTVNVNSYNSTSAVSVFNAKTFAREAYLSLPNCVDYTCFYPNDINQILLDPSHGDAYLVGTLSLFTLNLSTLSLVGTTVDYGDGPQGSSTYLPNTDQIIATYQNFMVGPGMLVQIHHGITTVLTSLLWLPVPLGILVTIQLVAAAIVVAWVAVRERRLRRYHSAPG